MRRALERFWLRQSLLDQIVAEAERCYPREIGGVLIGYWADGGLQAAATVVVGPGPNAVHQRDAFVPDYAYQKEQVARHYAASARRYTCLGDWHTHPRSADTG